MTEGTRGSRRITIAVVSIIVGLLAVGVRCAEAPPTQPEIEIQRLTHADRYFRSLEKCTISLEVPKPGNVNAGILKVGRSEHCRATYPEQLAVVGELLDGIRRAEPDRLVGLRTLFWGGPRTSEERRRLVNAYLSLEAPPADCSSPNCRMLEALSRSDSFADLEAVFSARGLNLRLKSVEGVHMVRVAELARFGIERATLVESLPDDVLVPVTAVVWFEIESGRKASGPGARRAAR